MSLSLSMPSVMADAMTASGLTADKLSLSALQSKMKCDPDSYETEVQLIYKQFNSSLELFQEQAALSFNSLSGIGNDPKLAKELGDKAMFLAHMRPVYPQYVASFPKQLIDLLHNTARSLPSFLRLQLTQALILLANKKIISIADTLPLFMELQTLGDKNLRKLLSSHVVNSIKRINQKHKNNPENRNLKKILFEMLQRDDESIAKRSLIVLCELHRRKVWFDDTTANTLCLACFHPSSKIMVASLSFLLDYDKLEDDDDSDASSEDEATPDAQVVLNKEAIYKAHHKGTTASKKKKQAKLQRVIRSMKRKQRVSTENRSLNNYSPLKHLKDAQGFVEKLFSRLQSCNERFEVKMMMLKVIARTVGLHSLILLNFYPYLQKYVQPHQREVTTLLAAAIQACHEMVPPDAVEPLFKQIVNQFVHDRSREEAITVGLNTVREICLRMPLLMTEDLLQDLVQYKKSHGKAVSIAARSLMYLFREVCPSLLTKKDRGRPIDPKARPKAFGEVNVDTNVPGIELLHQDGEDSEGEGRLQFLGTYPRMAEQCSSDKEPGKLEDTLTLFNQMTNNDPLPSIIDFNRLLSSSLKIKREYHHHATLHSTVLACYQQLELLGLSPDLYSHNIMINCYCRLGHVDFGLSLLGKIIKLGNEPDCTTFNTLINGLIINDKLDDVLEIFYNMANQGFEPDISSYGVLVKGLCRGGNNGAALSVLKKIEALGGGLMCQRSVYVYGTIIDSLCKNNQLGEALDVFSKMKRKGIFPHVIIYNSLIRVLCDSDRWEDARSLLDEMIDSSIGPTLETYNMLIDKFSKRGLVDEAQCVFRLMTERGVGPDTVTYSALMTGYCSKGQMGEASKLLAVMERNGCLPNVVSYTTLIDGYCKHKNIDRALDIFWEMPRKGLIPNVITYTTLMDTLCKIGKNNVAKQLLQDMQARGLSPDIIMNKILIDVL